MKVLYFGGQKSGKSRLAEQKALALAGDTTPTYIATYNKSFDDSEMRTRIARHRKDRNDTFVTVEEPLYLSRVIEPHGIYLIDCMSMWLLNTLEWNEAEVIAEIERLSAIDAMLIFVLNDVSRGVIPIDATSRKYVDRSGIVGQHLAAMCNEVYEVTLGLGRRLK